MADFLGETTDLLRRTPELLQALLTDPPESWVDDGRATGKVIVQP